MKKYFKKQNNGFTLIELLVTISIISLLSSIVFTTLINTRGKARDARRISDVKEIEKALFIVADSNNGIFPTTGVGPRNPGKCLGLGTGETCWDGGVLGDDSLNTAIQKFLSKVPADPSGRTGIGDRYVYGDQNSDVVLYCDSLYVKGPFILWVPEVAPADTTQCKNIGFKACCGSIDFPTCKGGVYCAYKIQQ